MENLKSLKNFQMKTILLLIFFLYAYNTYALDSLSQYYSIIGNAENAICKNDITKATRLYKQAFLYKKNPFFNDLSNALLCEIDVNNSLNDTTTCRNYFKKLLQQGLWRDSMVNAPYISELKNSRQWYLFKQILDTLHPLPYCEKSNKLNELLKRDQLVRKSCQNYRSDCIDEIKRIDSLNNLEFKILFQNSEYLDENVIGNYFIRIHLRTLLTHQISWSLFDVNDLLLNAVKEGILDARIYAAMADRFYIQQNIEKPTSEDIPIFMYGGEYGTELLRLYCDDAFVDEKTGKFNCNKIIAYIMVNYNDSSMLNELEFVNKNRSKIYLDNIIDESLRRIYLTQMKSYKSAIPILMNYDSGIGREKILNLRKEHNWKIYSYIQNEYDIDFK